MCDDVANEAKFSPLPVAARHCNVGKDNCDFSLAETFYHLKRLIGKIGQEHIIHYLKDLD